MIGLGSDKNWSDDVWDPYLTIQEEEESEGGTEGERRAFDAKPLLEDWGQLCLGQVGEFKIVW